MGVNLSKYSDGNTTVKRIRLDIQTNFKLKESNTTDKLSPFSYSYWNNLPYVALVEIYRYLSNKDKFNLSLTCKAWSQPFSSPEVWRHAHFLLDRIEECRTLPFIRSLASGLRHLVIDCRRTGSEIQPPRGSMNCLYAFLGGLSKCENCNLVTLRLVNMVRILRWFQWYPNRDILQVLKKFLSTQTNLKILDLSKAGFDRNQSIDLLSRLASTFGANITVLGITDLFSENAVPRITKWLRAYTNLKELSLNYQFLSNDLLRALAVCGSLVLINVIAKTFDIETEKRKDGWKIVKRSNPALRAHYTIQEDCGAIDLLQSILSPDIPLAALKLSWQAESFNWRLFCEYIATHFVSNLRRLAIEICTNMFSVENILAVIIERCQFLEELSITDPTDILSVQDSIEMTIRRDTVSQPGSRLHTLTFNGREVKLDLYWVNSLVNWLKV